MMGIRSSQSKLPGIEIQGACGCCFLDAFLSRRGELYVLFRAANDTIHRDMYLLQSNDHGATFQGSDISKWDVGYCVMSDEASVSGTGGTFAAWETGRQIHYSPIASGHTTLTDHVVSPSNTNQKYSSLAMNSAGLLLIAWTEGLSWKRGGAVNWRTVDGSGKAVGTPGSMDGVPAWSLVAAYPLKDGSFAVVY